MNITLMKYFITAAQCLNFSKAAELLYITQPALSRQISTLEGELNLQLFIRDSRSARLTPAGVVLLEEFEKIYDDYNLAIAKAQNVQKGLSGTLNIGILDGAVVGDLFPETLRYFNEFYPNLNVNLSNYSFAGLVERLYDGRLDLALTLFFDIKNRSKLEYEIIEKTRDYLVVLNSHPLSVKDKVSLLDFKEETFIMTCAEDSMESPRLIIDECKRQGFTPKVKFVPSVQSVMLMVESGVGVAILDGRNLLKRNPNVKFLNIDSNFEPYLTLAWHQDNKNSSRKLFTEVFLNKPKCECGC